MQKRNGLVEAVIVEFKDRAKGGGSYLNYDCICCTLDHANDGFCKVGNLIIHQDPYKLIGPIRTQTFLERKNDEAKIVLQTIEINRRGMYYL